MAVLRLFGALLIALLLAGAAFVVYAWRAESPAIDPPGADAFDRDLVAQGGTLASIGNCASCHTAEGGKPLAGGRAFRTPFGTIHATNITPDPETGIGRWSETAFRRAMREGVDREGRHLYPAFPYDHFTLVTDEDIRALYAFLMTREPVRVENTPNDLPFPYNVRMAVAGWKLLHFREGPYRPDGAQSVEWNRGAYLAEGLGHCGACHTPRNALGAEKREAHFGGAVVDGWYAYAINERSSAPAPWTSEALAFYLRHGWHQAHGMARGSMAPVVENLAAAPVADIQAIATYVGSFTEKAPARHAGGEEDAPVQRREKLTSSDSLISPPAVESQTAGSGARIYAATCATCHEAGRPLPFGGIDLRFSTAIHGASPLNLINVTLYGLPATSGEASPIMPGFRSALKDEQVEALVVFLRERLAEKPAWPGVGAMIRNARQTPPPLYPTPGMQAAPADPSDGGVAW
jgi:mono/diheme cytochrome c family protein